jgi:hypothetical protein
VLPSAVLLVSIGKLASSVKRFLIVVMMKMFSLKFQDEIDGWIIDELKKVGCDTAKVFLIKL